MRNSKTWARLLAALALATAGTAGMAQPANYPDRPINLIVPNAPGGAADGLARAFAEELGRRLKQSIVVENVGGASGILAAQKVLRAAPDGYTLLFGTTSDMVVSPIAIRNAGYSVKDFTAIAKLSTTPMTLVARPGLGIANADQLAALAKQRPNLISAGNSGTGSLQAFANMAVQKAAGIDLLGVPYKSGSQLYNDLLGGQLDVGVLALPGALPQVRQGKLVMLGVLSDKRPVAAPDLPTINESRSFKGVTIEIWAALAGPPALPPAIVERLNRTALEVLADKDFIERRGKMGDILSGPMTAAEFTQYLRTEDDRYRTLATGLKLE